MRILFMVLALVSVAGIAWPIIGAVAGGGNEATRLIEATERTETKAKDISSSYNDLIPPASPGTFAPTGAARSAPPQDVAPQGQQPGTPSPTTADVSNSVRAPAGGAPVSAPVRGAPVAAPVEDTEAAAEPTRDPRMSQSEHAVADAMEFLARVDQDLAPYDTEYTLAVDRLKRAWTPRYNRAVEEYRRFEERVEHAEEMAYEYLELQYSLTGTIRNPELRRTHEERDAHEQVVVLEWINQANTVLGQARLIKTQLDDMNVSITKLELSATFSAVYDGFLQMPFAITLLNDELSRFHDESEIIYQTFGPQAQE